MLRASAGGLGASLGAYVGCLGSFLGPLWAVLGGPDRSGGPRDAKDYPKSAPKSDQERPQEQPRAPEEGSKSEPRRTKIAQEGPKTPLKALRGALGDHISAYKLEKERSKSDLLRDSLEKPIRKDFSCIFDARAQERTF